MFDGGKVTTLGATSVVMILVNTQAWPKILFEIQNKKKLREEPDELIRARMFVEQLDVIVEFCTGLMGKMNKLADGADEEGANNQKARDNAII